MPTRRHQFWRCKVQRHYIADQLFLGLQIVVPSLGLSAAVPSGPHTAYLVLSAVNGTRGQLTVVNGRNTSEGPAGNENAPASSTAARTTSLLLAGPLHLPLFHCMPPCSMLGTAPWSSRRSL